MTYGVHMPGTFTPIIHTSSQIQWIFLRSKNIWHSHMAHIHTYHPQYPGKIPTHFEESNNVCNFDALLATWRDLPSQARRRAGLSCNLNPFLNHIKLFFSISSLLLLLMQSTLNVLFRPTFDGTNNLERNVCTRLLFAIMYTYWLYRLLFCFKKLLGFTMRASTLSTANTASFFLGIVRTHEIFDVGKSLLNCKVSDQCGNMPIWRRMDSISSLWRMWRFLLHNFFPTGDDRRSSVSLMERGSSTRFPFVGVDGAILVRRLATSSISISRTCNSQMMKLFTSIRYCRISVVWFAYFLLHLPFLCQKYLQCLCYLVTEKNVKLHKWYGFLLQILFFSTKYK